MGDAIVLVDYGLLARAAKRTTIEVGGGFWMIEMVVN